MSFTFRRAIRFDEIDAAGYAYFPKIAALAHEAIERAIAEASPGGYARFVNERRIGVPCVHLSCDFSAPLRFGDEIEVTFVVASIGETSIRFTVEVHRSDGVCAATIDYVVVCASLDVLEKRPIDDDLRAIFTPHLAASDAT